MRRRDIISRLHNLDANHQPKKEKKTKANVRTIWSFTEVNSETRFMDWLA